MTQPPALRTLPTGKGATFLLTSGLVLISLVPRLAKLDQPLLEKNSFRQTQTALTARSFAESGIDLLHYETPLFGPPWEVPFELPLFQAAVAVVGQALPREQPFDVACRLAAILFFYLSALVLVLVCRQLLDTPTSVWVLGLYLFLPFNIIYSRACFIDYTSVALALLFLFAVIQWFQTTSQLLWATIAVAAGSSAAMVKITTIPMVLPAVLLYAAWSLLSRHRTEERPMASEALRTNLGKAVQLLAMAALPSIAVLLWLRHTDQIKSASTLTQWLASSKLGHWTWGSMSQRLEWRSWDVILDRVNRLLTPGVLLVLPLLATLRLRRRAGGAALFVVSMALGAALPILLFFNLYAVHEYYLIAVAAPIAVVLGVGASALSSVAARRSVTRRVLQISLILLVAHALFASYRRTVEPLLDETPDPLRALEVAEMLRSATEPDDPIAMAQAHSAWNPTIPYYAERRFCILRNRAENASIDSFLREHGFHHAVLHRNNPLRLERWAKDPIASAGEYDLYRISYRERPEPAVPSHEAEKLIFSSRSPGALDTFVSVRDARIAALDDGLLIDAPGNNPYVLVRNVDPPAHHRLSIRASIEAPAATVLKIYFTTSVTHRYTEELHVRARLERGPNEVRLAIPHPEVRGPLRLDPGTVKGRYVLRRFDVFAQPLSEL